MDLLDEVVLKAEQAEAGLLGEDGDAVEAAAVEVDPVHVQLLQ